MIAFFAATGALTPAQAQFTGIYGFGDSYADTGLAPGGAFRLAGVGACIADPALCRFTGGTAFVESLQALYGLPTMTNYAIGGARTDNSNTLNGQSVPVALQPPATISGVPGFAYELEQLFENGVHFSKSDLIAISIGGNDLSATASTATVAQIQADATASAQRAVFGGDVVNGFTTGGVSQMIAAGANNIAWLSTGSSKYFPQPETGSDGHLFTATQRDAWANTYYQQLQELLAPYSHAGVRIFLFNFAILQERIWTDPVQYGFNANPTCQASLGEGSDCFYNNGVHPTAAAMALIANYMANQIDAPTTVVPQGAIATSIATGFTGSVFGRLDAERSFQPFGIGARSAAAAPTKAPAPGEPDHRWSIYGGVNYNSTSRDGQFLASGYDLTSVGGSLGIDFRRDQNWRLGGVFSYSEPDVKLDVQNARNHINAYQFGAYASYVDKNWFGDGLLAYGRQDFALTRSGIIDTIRGDTHADTFTVAARGGYLFDAGQFRFGPIAGLAYTRAVIDGYTETGDVLLTMKVDRQTLDNLTGDVGFQVRLPFIVGQGLYSPFVNVTLEHAFSGSGRTVTTTLVTAPLLPVLTEVPDKGRNYGKIAAGLAVAVAGNVNATLSASTTFARDGGNDFGVSAGIRVSF